MKWFTLTKERQEQIIRQTAQRTGNLPIVIEKDIWVCIVLKVLFESELKDVILFKGGTSLSKGYNIIKRFSEDIDIALDKSFFGFEAPLSNTQIDKLRKKVFKFTEENLMSIVHNGMIALGVPEEKFSIEIEEQKEKKDPSTLVVSFVPVTEINGNAYLLPRIKVDVSGRSLKDPKEKLEINTKIKEQFENIEEADINSIVNVVMPERTCLEKIFLLHEELSKEIPRYERMSRHLFDIDKIITYIGVDIILNLDLFEMIKAHRKIYTPIKSTDYNTLSMANIDFIPKDQDLVNYKNDYEVMKGNMFSDEEEVLEFERLIDVLKEINKLMNGHKHS